MKARYKKGDIVQYLGNGKIALIDCVADDNVYWCWIGKKALKHYELLYDHVSMTPLTFICEL